MRQVTVRLKQFYSFSVLLSARLDFGGKELFNFEEFLPSK